MAPASLAEAIMTSRRAAPVRLQGEGELPLAGFFLSFVQGHIANGSHKDFAYGSCTLSVLLAEIILSLRRTFRSPVLHHPGIGAANPFPVAKSCAAPTALQRCQGCALDRRMITHCVSMIASLPLVYPRKPWGVQREKVEAQRIDVLVADKPCLTPGFLCLTH
jgi:hypothetical protein